MLALPVAFTSCEDVLGHWEKPTPATPAPEGSIENPYKIASSADWEAIAAKVNAGDGNIHIKQTADLSGITTVIGTEENPFKGTYDGQGYAISDINITGENNLGLFGYVSSPDAVIENVVVTSGTVSGTGRSYGGIVGWLFAAGSDPFTLKNCHNGGNLVNTSGSDNSNNIIWGSKNMTGTSAVDPSNTYLSSMTFTLGGSPATLSEKAHGATSVTSNPAGITVGSKTYTKE